MTDRKALTETTETPEDVASLYSWANLHGAKYRDFSASRAQTREKARQRVEAAIEEEHKRTRQDAEAHQIADAQHAAEAQRAAEAAHQAEVAAQRAAQQAEMSARQAAQRAAEQAAHQAEMAAQQAARQAAQQAEMAARQAAEQAERAAQQAAEQRNWHAARAEQPARHDLFSALPAPAPEQPAAPNYAQAPQQPDNPSYAQPQGFAQAQFFQPAANAPLREEGYSPRSQWVAPEPRESPVRPAWLTAERSEVSNRAVPPTTEDTLQGSRDRLISRWFALHGVFDVPGAPVEAAPAPSASRAPVMAVFSLAGGVGKTSIVAALGRALSSRGERVLLVDTTAFGLLPFFFGARDQRPGVLRTFSPPSASGDAPIQMVTIDPETLGPEANGQELLAAEIAKNARSASRVIVDLGTASGATTRRIMRMSPMILVPVTPDMNSVVSVSSIDAFFQHNGNVAGKAALPHYVLNQFDPSLPLHLDIREVLREQLGDRLLPFVLRRTPAVSEALAEGMTVMDYAPNSPVAEDIGSLASWVKSLSAPASTGFRGVRWSER